MKNYPLFKVQQLSDPSVAYTIATYPVLYKHGNAIKVKTLRRVCKKAIFTGRPVNFCSTRFKFSIEYIGDTEQENLVLIEGLTEEESKYFLRVTR